MIDVGGIWEALEGEPSAPGGGYIRRLLDLSVAKVYLTQSRPQRQAGFRVETSEPAGQLWRDLRASYGLDVRVEARPNHAVSLQLTEVDLRFHDVFVALVQDLLRGLQTLGQQSPSDRPLVIDFLAARIGSWQACLKANNDGLSAERRAGLFGELTTMRRLIEAGADKLLTVEKWTGPDGAVQDYQFRNLTLEIKASRQTQPVNVRISSERQLDTSTLERLLLIHFGLDERSDGSGMTLPDAVAEARELHADNPHTSLLLDARLATYGYLDLHAPRYSDRSYAIRNVDFFHVRDDMPRIVEADLDVGVGKVAYDLSLAACEPFRITEDEALAAFATVQP